MRRAIGGAILAGVLASCTWGRSKPADCAVSATSGGFAELERVAAGTTGSVVIKHTLCTSKRERERVLEAAIRAAGLEPRRYAAEVGRCYSVETAVAPRAEPARAAVGMMCALAVETGTRYADWSTAAGGQFLLVSGDYVRSSPSVTKRPD